MDEIEQIRRAYYCAKQSVRAIGRQSLSLSGNRVRSRIVCDHSEETFLLSEYKQRFRKSPGF